MRPISTQRVYERGMYNMMVKRLLKFNITFSEHLLGRITGGLHGNIYETDGDISDNDAHIPIVHPDASGSTMTTFLCAASAIFLAACLIFR